MRRQNGKTLGVWRHRYPRSGCSSGGVFTEPSAGRLRLTENHVKHGENVKQAVFLPAHLSITISSFMMILPTNDATSRALAKLRRVNEQFRKRPWPAPFDATEHRLHLGDARDLSWLPDNSVHLVVTSPPYQARPCG